MNALTVNECIDGECSRTIQFTSIQRKLESSPEINIIVQNIKIENSKGKNNITFYFLFYFIFNSNDFQWFHLLASKRMNAPMCIVNALRMHCAIILF